MELGAFLEKDMVEFLDEIAEQRKEKIEITLREEELSIFDIKKDYAKEMELALEKNDLYSAKKIFDEMKRDYENMPDSTLKKKRAHHILQELHKKINHHVNKIEKEKTLIDELKDLEEEGFFSEKKDLTKTIESSALESGEIKLKNDILLSLQNVNQLLQNGKLKEAMILYKKTKAMFSGLKKTGVEEKEEIFNDLIAMYYQIKKSENLKKKEIETSKETRAKKKEGVVKQAEIQIKTVYAELEKSIANSEKENALAKWVQLQKIVENLPAHFPEKEKSQILLILQKEFTKIKRIDSAPIQIKPIRNARLEQQLRRTPETPPTAIAAKESAEVKEVELPKQPGDDLQKLKDAIISEEDTDVPLPPPSLTHHEATAQPPPPAPEPSVQQVPIQPQKQNLPELVQSQPPEPQINIAEEAVSAKDEQRNTIRPVLINKLNNAETLLNNNETEVSRKEINESKSLFDKNVECFSKEESKMINNKIKGLFKTMLDTEKKTKEQKKKTEIPKPVKEAPQLPPKEDVLEEAPTPQSEVPEPPEEPTVKITKENIDELTEQKMAQVNCHIYDNKLEDAKQEYHELKNLFTKNVQDYTTQNRQLYYKKLIDIFKELQKKQAVWEKEKKKAEYEAKQQAQQKKEKQYIMSAIKVRRLMQDINGTIRRGKTHEATLQILEAKQMVNKLPGVLNDEKKHILDILANQAQMVHELKQNKQLERKYKKAKKTLDGFQEDVQKEVTV